VVIGVLDAHAHPHVCGTSELGAQRGEPPGALGEDLEAMPVRAAHDVEHPSISSNTRLKAGDVHEHEVV
jgi:hypothetical protein